MWLLVPTVFSSGGAYQSSLEAVEKLAPPASAGVGDGSGGGSAATLDVGGAVDEDMPGVRGVTTHWPQGTKLIPLQRWRLLNTTGLTCPPLWLTCCASCCDGFTVALWGPLLTTRAFEQRLQSGTQGTGG